MSSIQVIKNNNIQIVQSMSSQNRVDDNLMERFIEYLDVKKNSSTTYKRALKQFLIFLSIYQIGYPKTEDVKYFKNYLADKGLKPTTIQNYLNAVKLFFNWTEQEGLYKDIAKHVKPPKVSKEHKKDYFTDEQAKRLLDSIDTSTVIGKRDFAMIFLMITTGIRECEIVNANIEDMRLLGNSIVLYILGKGRTEKAECVKVSGPVEQAIRIYLSYRKEYKPEDPMFVSAGNKNQNGRLNTRTIRRLKDNYFGKIGLKDKNHSIHSFRHTFVTLALVAGNDITETQQAARHSSVNTTMIYNHALEIEKNTCSEDVTNMVI